MTIFNLPLWCISFFTCYVPFTVVDCGKLAELENGQVKLADGRTTHGALAEFTCKDNYTLVGDARRRCGDGGIWSGHQPQCLCKCNCIINHNLALHNVQRFQDENMYLTETIFCEDYYRLLLFIWSDFVWHNYIDSYDFSNVFILELLILRSVF